MQVHVEDGLAGIAAGVDDHAVAGLIEATFPGQARRHPVQVTDDRLILCRQRVERFNVFARNHDEMRGGTRPDVLKRHRRIIFVDKLGRRFTPSNPAKKAVHGGVAHVQSVHGVVISSYGTDPKTPRSGPTRSLCFADQKFPKRRDLSCFEGAYQPLPVNGHVLKEI